VSTYVLDAPQRSIEHLLFLESRSVRRGVGNLVSAGAYGWVRFWECHAEGELVAQFNAGHRPGASVTALCSDRRSYQFLVTGDTDGYVKVWYVAQYANGSAAFDAPARPSDEDRFQLLRESMILRLLTVQQGRFRPPPAASDPDRTWTAPMLVTSFHAHLNVVTSLDYVESRDCFVSSSDDCSVRMWTVYGAFVGIFGQETPWLPLEPPLSEQRASEPDSGRRTSAQGPTGGSASRPSTGRSGSVEGEPLWQQRRLPADVRRVASACTLRVMYGGHVPQWKVTKVKLLAYVEVHQRMMDIIRQRRQEDDSSTAVLPVADVMLKLSELPSVEHSKILGKAYKRQRRYRPLPPVPRVLQNDVKVSSS